MSEQKITLGHIAFNAYKEAKQGRTYDAKPIPAWDAVGDDVRQAWEAAADAVKQQVEFDAMIERNVKKK
jgi:hypothetical protein